MLSSDRLVPLLLDSLALRPLDLRPLDLLAI